MTLRPGDLNLADPEAMSAWGMPPVDYFRVLRAEAPVHWNPPPPPPTQHEQFVLEGFWVLSKHRDVMLASQDAKRFSCAVAGPLWLEPDATSFTSREAITQHLMGMDPPQHTQYRRLVQPGFTPRGVAAYEPIVRHYAERVVADLAKRDRAEFVFDVAAEPPMILLCEMMGVPQERRAEYFALGNGIASFESPDHDSQAQIKLYMLCDELTAACPADNNETLLAKYLHGTVDGRKLSRDEVNGFFSVLSIAAHETTRNTTAHFVRLMDEYPDQKALLLDDLEGRLPNAIEEVLRFSPPVMQFCRIATENIELRGQTIKAGDKVMLSYVSANRDEDVFDDPDRFDILRRNATSHLAFGAGAHYCLGADFAKMQLRILLTELYRKIPDIALTDAPTRLSSVWFNALTAMPVSTCPVAHA